MTTLFVLRSSLGLLFAWFGLLKLTRDRAAKRAFFARVGLHPAALFLGVVAGVELVGGLLLLLGVLVRPIALLFALIMLAASVIKARDKGALPNDIEFYLVILAAALALSLS